MRVAKGAFVSAATRIVSFLIRGSAHQKRPPRFSSSSSTLKHIHHQTQGLRGRHHPLANGKAKRWLVLGVGRNANSTLKRWKTKKHLNENETKKCKSGGTFHTPQISCPFSGDTHTHTCSHTCTQCSETNVCDLWC